MAKKYYKVVSEDLKSVITSKNDYEYISNMSVQYKVGEWVKPHVEGTNLMVFDNYYAADRFKYINSPDGFVYECEISGIVKFPLFFRIYNLEYNWAKFIKLANKRKNKQKISHLVDLNIRPPKGTVFCNKVKLLKKASING